MVITLPRVQNLMHHFRDPSSSGLFLIHLEGVRAHLRGDRIEVRKSYWSELEKPAR